MGNGLSGTPLTQALVYCRHNDCPELIDKSIVQNLVSSLEPASLDIEIIYSFSHNKKSVCSIIEMAIALQRMDVVKVLVEKGANPIYVGADPREISGVIQLLNEYYKFGTNKYISWLLHEHLSHAEIPKFIGNIMGVNIFNERAEQMFKRVGRHAAHALLVCGHKQMSSALLKTHGDHLLTVQDGNGRTALLVAASQGDLDSVKVIFNL